MHRISVVSHPRSGSNFLRDILNQHPDIYMAGEAFHTDPLVRRQAYDRANTFRPMDQVPAGASFSSAEKEQQIGLDTIDHFLDRCGRITGRPVLGVTVFSRARGHALELPEVERLALHPDIRPVLLVRRNLLKAWVSYHRALDTGIWHLDASGLPLVDPDRPPAADALIRWTEALDPEEALAWIEEARQFLGRVQGTLEREGKPWLEVCYEDLCLAGPEGTRRDLDRLLAFLGLDRLSAFEPTLAQTAAGEYYDAIPNRQELMDATGCDLDPPPSSPQGWVARVNLLVRHCRAQRLTLAIAPAGRYARSLLAQSELRQAHLAGCFDRDPGTGCEGVQVHPYSAFPQVRPDLVLVASPLREDEIALELQAHGCPADSIVRLSALPAAQEPAYASGGPATNT